MDPKIRSKMLVDASLIIVSGVISDNNINYSILINFFFLINSGYYHLWDQNLALAPSAK